MNQLCIGLVALKGADSISAGVQKVRDALAECRTRGVQIACFSETYLPGLRGASFDVPPPDQERMEQAMLVRECQPSYAIPEFSHQPHRS